MSGSLDNPLGTYLKDRRTRLGPSAFGFSAKRPRVPGPAAGRSRPAWQCQPDMADGRLDPGMMVYHPVGTAVAREPAEKDAPFA